METLYRDKDAVSAIDACQGTPLQKIVQKARYLHSLNATVKALLPAEFSAHCRVMNTHDTILVLGVDSAAIATRLRFLSSELIDQLKKIGVFATLKQITFRVTP